MRLTAYSNFSLRLLMYCALNPGRLVRIEDVARAHGISRAHLLKSARQLGHLGYLVNVRGRSGGVRLGREPASIVVGEVIRHTEGDLTLVECFSEPTNTCRLIGVCRLTGLFCRALQAFLAELDKVTVADLVADAPSLRARLDLAQQAAE